MYRYILSALVIVLCNAFATAQSINTVVAARPGARVQATIALYKTTQQAITYNVVKQQYDSLVALADKEEEPTLQIAAYTLLGGYYRSKDARDYTQAERWYEKALAVAEKEKLKKVTPLLIHELGNIYYKHEKYAQGLEYLLRANILMQQIGFDNYPDNAVYLYDIGYAYAYNFEDFTNAKEYLSAAVKLKFPDPYTEIQCYNMLGLVYRTVGSLDSALTFFNTAMAKAKAINDTASMGDISGNIGFHYYIQKQFDKAIPLFLKDYNTGIEDKNWVTASLALLVLADIDVQMGQLDSANVKIANARVLIDSARIKYTHKAVYTAYYSLYSTLVKMAKLQHNEKATAVYLDSLMLYKDSLTDTRDAKIQSAVQIKLLKENNKYELELLKSEERRKIVLRNALLIISLLVIIIIIQILYRLKIKSRKDAEQLSFYADSLFEKNQLIEQFKSEVEQIKEQPQMIENEIEDTFNKLRNFTILTEQQWLDFKMLFEKIYKNFFTNISEKIPDLTQAEMRLLALTKLGLSTKQMAEMQGITAESIRKAKYRLRKKIEVKVKEDRENFFMLKNI